jgi:hypothetical protein
VSTVSKVPRFSTPVSESVCASRYSFDSAICRRLSSRDSASRAARDERGEQAHQHGRPDRAVPPRRIDVGLGGRDVDGQRQVREVLVHIDAPHVVDHADADDRAFAVASRFDEQLRVAQVQPHHARVVRQARHERAVVLDDRRAAVRADRETVEQRAEIIDAERADDDPAERPVGQRDPAAQCDRQRAAAQPRRIRAADVKPLREPVAMDGEIIAIGKIALPRRRDARIDHDIAARIHHENGAEIRAVCRAVEQHPMTLGGRQCRQFRIGEPVHDVLQR